MVERVDCDHACQALSEVAAWAPRKDFVQVSTSVLLGRLPVEDRDGEGIRDWNCRDAATKGRGVDGAQQLTHRHQRHGLVPMDGRQNSKRGTALLAGDEMEAKPK